MSRAKLLSLFPFCLTLAIIFIQQATADDADHAQCLNRIGGLQNILEKKLVNEDKYDPKTEIQISKIPHPFRINRPNQPITEDYNQNRITLSVDINGVVTDAECI